MNIIRKIKRKLVKIKGNANLIKNINSLQNMKIMAFDYGYINSVKMRMPVDKENKAIVI